MASIIFKFKNYYILNFDHIVEMIFHKIQPRKKCSVKTIIKVIRKYLPKRLAKLKSANLLNLNLQNFNFVKYQPHQKFSEFAPEKNTVEQEICLLLYFFRFLPKLFFSDQLFRIFVKIYQKAIKKFFQHLLQP
eukprot:TRINITY_DN5389_c2_g1_i12.p1 TRINITY_DN5389_c2_g1~~TRINITY_DN5389_c2_g1_i12.p1  ORF type:complete len:133 (+),score=4.86 TRINITY_DN5389_c2_g1_i12:468-866(+)